MGLAPAQDRGEIANMGEEMVENQPCLFCQHLWSLSGAVEELGVDRKHDIRGLHRGVDYHLFSVLGVTCH
jgi:hypothetical protein